MVTQVEFALRARSRGCHLITDEVCSHLGVLPRFGLLHLFIKHTSAALSINENADSDVRSDLDKIMDNLIPERQSWYDHVDEGWDDMPAHGKSSVIGVGITIPITDGQLNLGTGQGIYLCEFRNYGGPRKVVATVMGE